MTSPLEALFGNVADEPAALGPRTLDCGHTDWFPPAAHAAARAAGHCCEGGRTNHAIQWDRLRGPHVRPLPVGLRATWERVNDRSRSRGFPGYCCDEAGFYIGGVGNDCRHHGPSGEPCPAHRKDPPAPPADDEDENEVVIEVPTAGPAPRKMTFKERQLQQQRRKGK